MKDLAEAWLPLSGIKVVDFSMFVPGPFASAILADLGAEERQALERGYAEFPVWANGRRGARIRAGTPRLGEHTREILVELGFDDGEIADLARAKAVFAS